MANIVRTFRSTTAAAVPTTLPDGQLAINIADKKMWIGDSTDAPVEIPTVGPAGPQGDQGPKGDTGAQGPAGADGADGAPGSDGFDPYISDGTDGNTAGNWVDETGDTGVAATGPQGPAGADGADGTDGAQGPAGPEGPEGPTAVSVDPGNTAVLGSDSLIFVPDAAGSAAPIYADTAPDATTLDEGQIWIDTTDMFHWKVYDDPTQGKIWVDAGNGTKGEDGTDGQDGVSPEIGGFKNVLINGDFRVNQRGFSGNWNDGATFAGDYGYDRWAKWDEFDIYQYIEDKNLINGETYTLSWDGGGEGRIISETTITGTSPITGVVTLGTTADAVRVRVPNTATNIQLERGNTATSFEKRHIAVELLMCYRYFWRWNASTLAYWTSTAARAQHIICEIAFPTAMRGSIAWTEVQAPTYSSSTANAQPAQIKNSGFVYRCDVTAAATNCRVHEGKYSFDSEL